MFIKHQFLEHRTGDGTLLNLYDTNSKISHVRQCYYVQLFHISTRKLDWVKKVLNAQNI